MVSTSSRWKTPSLDPTQSIRLRFYFQKSFIFIVFAQSSEPENKSTLDWKITQGLWCPQISFGTVKQLQKMWL